MSKIIMDTLAGHHDRLTDLENLSVLCSKKHEEHESGFRRIHSHNQRCDDLHTKVKEQYKRQDDAINHLTASNLLLVESIDSLNTNVCLLVSRNKEDAPSIVWVKEVMAGATFGKKLWLFIVAFCAGMAAIGGSVAIFKNML